jgi:AcrR family transcriptional regulator
MPAPSSRIERRRVERGARILRIAGRRFAERGIHGVRLDEIADEADIARATFYTHFATKEALLSAIVRPALEQAAQGASLLRARDPRAAVRELLQLHARLWRAHPEAMTIGHAAGAGLPADCAELHGSFMRQVLRLFGRADQASLLRGGDPKLAALLLARMAVPMLLTYEGHPRADELFLQSMEAVLLTDAGEGGRGPAAPRLAAGRPDS